MWYLILSTSLGPQSTHLSCQSVLLRTHYLSQHLSWNIDMTGWLCGSLDVEEVLFCISNHKTTEVRGGWLPHESNLITKRHRSITYALHARIFPCYWLLNPLINEYKHNGRNKELLCMSHWTPYVVTPQWVVYWRRAVNNPVHFFFLQGAFLKIWANWIKRSLRRTTVWLNPDPEVRFPRFASPMFISFCLFSTLHGHFCGHFLGRLFFSCTGAELRQLNWYCRGTLMTKPPKRTVHDSIVNNNIWVM